VSDPATPNKGYDLPSTGEYPSAWGPVINNNFTEIDTCFGGVTNISVTSIPAGTYSLSETQYMPTNIKFFGVLTANLNFVVPNNVGGFWSVLNETTGAFTLTFGSSSSSQTLIQGDRAAFMCDGAHMEVWQTIGTGANPMAEVGLTPVDGTAVTFMRSDAAPALDQTISPDMTGEWTFGGTVELNGGVALQSTMALSSGAVINATGGGLECATQTPGTANQTVASTAFVAASFAPVMSPAFTDVPTAPTAANGTNTTQIATTAFAFGALGVSGDHGHVVLPNGLVLQWGIDAFTSSGSAITFGSLSGCIAFPTGCIWACCNAYGGAATAYTLSFNATTLTCVNGANASNSWWAIGN
jgi:hypothetical protein